MRDVLYLEEIEQAEALLKPQRVEVLRQLAEPRTCSEVAERLGQTPQRVYYHVKRLVEAGLVDLVSERKVRGIHEGIYQAGARSYWLSPRLVGRIGLRKARDELSLGYLLDLMEEVQSDIAALDRSAPELPSIGLSGEIRVRPEERQEFLNDLQTMLQGLFTRYGGAEGDAFKLAVACYPNATADPPATVDPPAATGPAPSTPPAAAGPSSPDAPPAPTGETGPHRRPGGGDRPQPA
ncbi:helix-turn-helix domain-containing protein [Nonomuraea angiospora]|uniref:helix-turn-helix domain-containing protein n=1 Tax=Nonomuraea angiospora TaxID=46172 RepID=UPI0033337C3F